MRDSAKVLNWTIGGYIVVKLFGYSAILAVDSSLRIIFVLAPICLLVWQGVLLRNRVRKPGEDRGALFYECVESGDWGRVFWILWIGHRTLASGHVFGFYMFSGLVAFLLSMLVFSASVEFYRKRKVTTLVLGCLAFCFFLFICEKNMYVIHFGVPVVGHFFEKPEYDAIYRVEVQETTDRAEFYDALYRKEVDPAYSGGRIKAIADIHVEGRTETRDYGEEDRFGQSITHTDAYRDVWIRKLYLPSGGTIVVKQQNEPLHLGVPGFVIDSSGRSWYVRL